MGAENFEFVYSENMFVVEDAAAALRDYASQGYNLVIGHGSQYGSSLQEIAPDFPDTSFAWGTTVDTFGIPNIYAYEARSEEGGYVNGVLAANLSESNTCLLYTSFPRQIPASWPIVRFAFATAGDAGRAGRRGDYAPVVRRQPVHGL